MRKQKVCTDIRPYTRQFYRGNWLCLILSAVETLLNVAGNLLLAWLIQQIFDLIAGYDTGFSLLDLTLLTALLATGIAMSYLLSYYAKPRFINQGIARYKEYVFRELTRKNISAFSGENTSFYISALSNDTNTIENGYLGKIFPILQNVLMLTGALILMFWYSPLLTVISIALSMLPVIVSLLVGNRLAEAEKRVSDLNESYVSALKDSLSGFSVVKSFQAEAQVCRIFGGNVKRLTEVKDRRTRLAILIEMLSAVAGIVAQAGVFLVGAYLALSGIHITVGTVIAFVQMMNYVLGPIATVPGYLAEIKASKALIRKMAAALPENVRETGTVECAELVKGIHIDGLSYSYESEKPVLQNLNVCFEAGKSYAIVGASGSGKSTLLNLLMASDDRYTGSIHYDDTELREIHSESLYEMVSAVQQNVFIFNASIRDNITMFSDFPREEVERAIERSGLSALITERGEDYLCGENGSGLSGGEKQRISIARSLLKKSQVLLVDEATAALDSQTAWQVASAILDLKGITRIVVTHALDENLLRRYDCVLALRNGRIAESGSFDALMDRKGYFYSLFTVSQ